MKKLNTAFYNQLTKLFVVLVIAVIGFNIYQTYSINTLYSEKLAEAEELAKPSKIELLVLEDSNCQDCFKIDTLVDAVLNMNVEILKNQKVDYNSAGNEIVKYGITKLPTIIITGETEKLKLSGFEQVEDALVFTSPNLPYTLASSGNVLGRVTATIIEDETCDKCIDLSAVYASLESQGIALVSKNIVERNSAEGKKLLKNYPLKALPVLLLSKEFGKYQVGIVENWDSIGEIAADGTYYTDIVAVPYINLTTNKVMGLVNVYYIEDDSCPSCYNAESFNKPILNQMGLVFGKETIMYTSSTDTKKLLEQYNITKVPTIVLKGDTGLYPSLVQAWGPVGTIESDGAYILRNLDLLKQTYFDLEIGEVVRPLTS